MVIDLKGIKNAKQEQLNNNNILVIIKCNALKKQLPNEEHKYKYEYKN